MTKEKLSLGQPLMVLLSALVSYPASSAHAAAAPEPASAASAGQKPRDPGLRNPGQLSTLFKIDDADPESSVPTAKQRDGNPLEYGYFIQDLLAKGEIASKKNDHRAAVRYYRALAVAVPNNAQPWSLLCEAYQLVNDRQRALGACKYAIDREGAQLKDHVRFVQLMVGKEGDLAAEEVTALNEVLTHLDKEPDLAIPTAHLRCESAVKMKDKAAMAACTAVLAKAAPDDPKTIVFQWSLAVMRGQRDEAARLIGRAEQAGVALEGIEQMRRVAPGRWTSPGLMGAAALGGGAILLALLLLRRRFVTRRA